MKALYTKFQKPYYKSETGKYKCAFNHLREYGKQAGVYIIKDPATNEIIYIGSSNTQLYKTLYRHFETWNDKQQERAVYNKHKFVVRVIYTTPNRAEILERYLIARFKPIDNLHKFEANINDSIKSKDILDDSKEIKPTDICPF